MKRKLISHITCGMVLASSFFSTARAETDAADEQAKALGQYDQTATSPNKRSGAQWFADAGLGLFIHWGMSTVWGEGDLSWCMLKNKPWQDGEITPNHYYALRKKWNPSKMDFDTILGKAKAIGVTYAVFTTKHHDGFTFWPTDLGEIGTKETFGGRDFVKEFVDACHKHGLKVGFYYSPPDWYFDRKFRSFAHRGPAVGMDHEPITVPTAPPEHAKARGEMLRGHIRELLTRYGKIDLIWFDGGNGREIFNDEVRKLQPDIVLNRRNGGGGDYGDSEGKLPAKPRPGWFEACVPAWPQRKWSYVKEYPAAPAEMVLTELSILSSFGGNLLSNLGPMADGSLPPGTEEVWQEMTAWMKHSRESVIGVRRGPFPADSNQPVTIRGKSAYLHFIPSLPEKMAGYPVSEKTLTRTRDIIPPLPERTDTIVWRNAPKPAKAILLRTGQDVPFTYENGTLTVKLDEALRTKLVDVVKLDFTE